MNIETIREFLGWCTVINIGLLAFSSIMVVSCRKWIAGIHGWMFGLDEAEMPREYLRYLANFKIAVIIFNLVPYVALRIIG